MKAGVFDLLVQRPAVARTIAVNLLQVAGIPGCRIVAVGNIGFAGGPLDVTKRRTALSFQHCLCSIAVGMTVILKRFLKPLWTPLNFLQTEGHQHGIVDRVAQWLKHRLEWLRWE